MAGKHPLRSAQPFASAVTLAPLIVGALLVAIVAIFIFEAPDQITTPVETGYLNTEMPVATTVVDSTHG